jgi:hypothetical protein
MKKKQRRQRSCDIVRVEEEYEWDLIKNKNLMGKLENSLMWSKLKKQFSTCSWAAFRSTSSFTFDCVLIFIRHVNWFHQLHRARISASTARQLLIHRIECARSSLTKDARKLSRHCVWTCFSKLHNMLMMMRNNIFAMLETAEHELNSNNFDINEAIPFLQHDSSSSFMSFHCTYGCS